MLDPADYLGESVSAPKAREAAVLHQAAFENPTGTLRLAGWPDPTKEADASEEAMAEELRPRTRLRTAGAGSLSAAELLAVLLSAFPGTSEAQALELAGRAISEAGGLHGLLRSPSHELVGTAGVGEAKASVLLAAAELGKRLVSESGPVRPVISGPGDVYELLRGRLAHLDRERFIVLLLNTKNAVIESHTVSIGTLSSAIVHPREIFKPAIQASAASIILAHNHPSGHTEPSREDREVTRRIVESGETIGIEVLDHLIIGDGYLSLKERGLL